MLYNAPSFSANANASFVGKDIDANAQGSKVPRMAVEGPQRELVAIIQAGQALGLDAPTNNDLTQVLKTIRSGFLNRFVATGTPDAIAITPQPAYLALIEGMRFRVKIPGAAGTFNTTATPIFTVNGLGAPIRRNESSALLPGDLIAGRVLEFEIDAAGLARVTGLVPSQIPPALAGNGFVFAQGVSVLAYLSASTAIANSTTTETSVPWSGVAGAPPGMWSAADPTKLFIPAKVTGIEVVSTACFEANATGSRKMRVLMDGDQEGNGLPNARTSSADPTDVTILNGPPGPFDITINGTRLPDGSRFLQQRLIQNSGAALNVRPVNTWLGLKFVR